MLAPKNHVRVKDARKAVKRKDTLHVWVKQITQKKKQISNSLNKVVFHFLFKQRQ